MSTIKSSAEDLILNADGASSEVKIQQNGTTAITIDSSENVGIGDASPDRKLHVNSGTTNVVAKFESTDSVAAIEFTDSAGSAEIGCVGNDVAFFPAGVEKMRIDSSGRVTMPNQAACIVTPSGGWQNTTTYPSSTDNKLKLDNVHKETGGSNFDTTNHRYTIPVSGYYQIHGQAYGHSNDYVHTEIRVNGSVMSLNGNNATHTYDDPYSTGVTNLIWNGAYYFSSNDYVEWFFKQVSVSNSSYTVYHGHTHASIILLA